MVSDKYKCNFPIYIHNPPKSYPQTPWRPMDPRLRHPASIDSCLCSHFYLTSREVEWGTGQWSACMGPSEAMMSAVTLKTQQGTMSLPMSLTSKHCHFPGAIPCQFSASPDRESVSGIEKHVPCSP